MRGSADMLQRAGADESKRRRYVDAIVETADRAARLTGQLLAFARRQALKPETFDAVARIESIGEMLRTLLSGRVTLQILADCDSCLVKADAAHFETALVNMAVNARDAMDGEGELSIRVSRTSELPEELQPSSAESYVAISVTDTGHGIPPKDLDKIFEPFFTTKEVGKGTGLGLSQVYGFTAQSEGEVRIDSAPGRGTTVTLLLPCSDEPAAVPAPSGQAKPGVCPGDSCRILVVDDNEEVGAFAQALLVELGHQVVRAASGAEALERFDEDEIDLVFTDIVMPGMDGLELADRLRARAPGLPIILATGFSEQIAGSAERKLPVLFKPYKPEALAAAVDQAMAERG
jgi:CheY-like chemotaxis protein